ncbi:MAG: tetratricopeptide repeat protein [Oligoflexia bacterium]|nr:tetratricopeptide repeat protein [Oligoflexia bacterium]
MKSTFLKLLVLTAVLTASPSLFAKVNKSKKSVGKAAKVTKSLPAKKKTVGDMLEDIDTKSRGAQNLSIKKQTLALPDVQKTNTSNMPLFEVKPPKSSELFKEAGSDDERLEQITDQGINELYKLTRKYAKSKNRGELWLRLAELYVEKAKYIEYRIQKTYDEQLNAYLAKKISKPRLNLTPSRDYNLKAIKLYEWFLRDFPNDPKVDQALFFLGYNHMEMDQIKKGVGFYQRLTKEYPNSSYVSEAYFALGEYYFDNDKWADALKSYTDLLKNPRARLYTFANYKIAWCQYRMGRVGQGLKTLEQVIKQSRAPTDLEKVEGRRAVSKIRLGSEALKDAVLFYVDVGNYQSSRQYFYQLGGEKAVWIMLEKLAYLYSDTGRKEQAQFVFKQLLEHNPIAPKAFDYQYQIVTNFATSKNQKVYRDELYNWVDRYSVDSTWGRANANNPKLIEDSNILREMALRNYTLQLHRNAQNSQRKQDMHLVKEAYQLYLNKFTEGVKSTEMHFFYAELLFALGDFDNAGKQYRIVAEKDPRGKYFQPAVLNSLLSLEKSLKSDEQVKQIVGNSLESVPFGEIENAFVSAAEYYITTFPKGDKVVDVKFKVGRLHYSYNHLDDALKNFKLVVAQHPRTPFAVYSANLILDIYNLRKDYDGLAREGNQLIRNKDLAQQGFTADVKDVVEKVSFKKAQDLEVAKNYEASANSFAEFARNNPKSSLAFSAIFNAGVNYERAHKIPQAIGFYSRAGRTPSKGNEKLYQKSILLLGKLYEQTAQYEKAAVQYEKYAKENPNDKVTPDLYHNSAIFWEGQKEFGRAIVNYEKYYEKSRRRDRTLALFTIASINEKLNRLKLAQAGYERYLKEGGNDPEKVVEANFKIADINFKLNKIPEAEKGYQRTVAVGHALSEKSKGAGQVWAAEAKFRLTERVYNDFVSIRIPANPQKQGQAIKEKLGLLTKLSTHLAEVIKYDEGNMVIASLTRLGQAYEHMSKAVWNTAIPAGLNKEEEGAYKKGIDGVAEPLKQKAVENYTAAINKSFEINFYNKWTKLSLSKMGEYQPDRYSAPKEIMFHGNKSDDMGIM